MLKKFKKLLAKITIFSDYVHHRWWYYTAFFTNDKKNLHYWKTPLESGRFFIYLIILKVLVVVDNLVCYDSDTDGYYIQVLKKNMVVRYLLYIPGILARSLVKFFRRLINIVIAKQTIRLQGLPIILDREYKNYLSNSFACLTGEFWTWPALYQGMYLCWIDKLLCQQKEFGFTTYEQPKAEDWHKVQCEIAEFKRSLSSSSLRRRRRKK